MSFFFFEQKGTEAGENAFPEVSGRPSAVFRDKFSRCFANAAAGPDARLSGLSRKNKGTHPGRFGQTAFVPTGRGAGGIRYERGADSAEDRAASSGQTVPQNSAYDGLFRLFRRLVGTISCRLRTSETGDRPRESSAFLPTDGAGRCSRSPRWGPRGRTILLRRIRCRRGAFAGVRFFSRAHFVGKNAVALAGERRI